MQHLQQQLNVAMVSSDPALVAEAWAAIDAARSETAQVRQEAQTYVHSVELSATQAVTKAQSVATAARAEASQHVAEVERQAPAAVAAARSQASQAEASA